MIERRRDRERMRDRERGVRRIEGRRKTTRTINLGTPVSRTERRFVIERN